MNIDDELLETAKAYTGIEETAELIRVAVRRLVEQEAALRLARLGGSMPDLKAPRRRRSAKAGHS